MSQTESIAQTDWTPQPVAEAFVQGLVAEVLAALPAAARLADRLINEAGVRLIDLIDTFHVPAGATVMADAHAAGWTEAEDDPRLLRNANGVFPQIAMTAESTNVRIGIDLKVESVAHFLFAHGITADIDGDVDAPWRRATIAEGDIHSLGVVERHGWRGLRSNEQRIDLALRQRVYESLLTRERPIADDRRGFDVAESRIDDAIARVGRDVTCEIFFQTEREYWMRRNRAARFQFARQNALGIGWANHDHHTYRSSRTHFAQLIAIWEKLGLVCRERFYAGREAGWGAQVMEQPVTGIVTFNDVDLSPDELFGDFAHDGLAPRDRLGTIGLWCGLHGESFTAAGMHHLEAMFGFDALRTQLTDAGVGVMKPFTDFGYLRQAFTEGERWAVPPVRIDHLLAGALITPQQAETFRANGALGSHLENLERNQGFKGFNQTGVSEIIAATDPRGHSA